VYEQAKPAVKRGEMMAILHWMHTNNDIMLDEGSNKMIFI